MAALMARLPAAESLLLFPLGAPIYAPAAAASSHCETKIVMRFLSRGFSNRRSRASRHVVIAAVRRTLCDLADVRWRGG